MKLFILILLLPCCVKAQTVAYNHDSTVYLTTTDPRITIQYIGHDTIPATIVMADTVKAGMGKRLALIIAGYVVRDRQGNDIAYLRGDKCRIHFKIEFYAQGRQPWKDESFHKYPINQ